MTNHQTWKQRAACRNHPRPNIFHPDRGGAEFAHEARAVCARCPVTDQCYDYGKDLPYGIWGGLTEKQRRRKRQGLPVAEARRPKVTWPDRECPWCSTTFTPRVYNQKYCSPPCGWRHWTQTCRADGRVYRRSKRRRSPLPEIECPYCKTEFTPQHARRRYCSDRCRVKDYHERRRQEKAS